MRTFPAAFATELAKKTGITPVWVLRLTVNSVVYDLSDSVFVFPVGIANGFTITLPWVAQWGALRESVSGTIGEMLVSDFSCSLLVDQDNADNIRHLALSHPLEQSPVELYLWLDGLTNATPPQRLFVGYVKDIDIPDETMVNITIEDESTRFQKYIGTQISSEAYPLCDPDAVGKMIPIIYGAVSKFPALCIESGWVTSLAEPLGKSSTTVTVSEIPTYSLRNKYIWLEEEIVYVTAQTGKTITVLRAALSTIAVDHDKGKMVAERMTTPLVYLLADHAVDSIGTIFTLIRGVRVDITSDCTKYPSGNTAYPGKALVTIADFFKVSQNIALALTGNVTVSSSAHTHVAGTLTTTTGTPFSWTMSPSPVVLTAALTLNSITTGGVWKTFRKSLYINFPAPPAGVLTRRIRFTINCSSAAAGEYIWVGLSGYGWLNIGGDYVINSGNRAYTFDFNPNSMGIAQTSGALIEISVPMAKLWVASGQLQSFGTYTYYVTVSAVDDIGTYNSTTSSNVSIASANVPITIANSLGLSGNSISDIYIGEKVLADVTRNITAPAAVIGNLLSTYCNDATLTTVGTLPAYYSFNGALTEYKKAIDWIDYLSFQCRAYFRKMGGVSKLIVRDVNPVVSGIIPACCLTDEGIKQLSFRKSPLTDVINIVAVNCSRDWTAAGKKADSYTQTVSLTHDASIVTFGEQQRPDMFMFDFVTDNTMAYSLASFYLDFYSARKWRISFSTYLDNAKYEFGDIVQLTFNNDQVGSIVEAGITPGSINQIDKMNFIIEAAIIQTPDVNGLTTLLNEQLHFMNGEVITYV